MQNSIIRGESGEGEEERRKLYIVVTLMIKSSCSLNRVFKMFNFEEKNSQMRRWLGRRTED